MKRKDLLIAQNRDCIGFLAERLQAIQTIRSVIREQQRALSQLLQWLETVHGKHAPAERERVRGKMQALLAAITAGMPEEPPEAKLTMSFEQLQEITRSIYENLYQLKEISQVQMSLHYQLLQYSFRPARTFVQAMYAMRDESDAMLTAVEQSAARVMDGEIEEVPPEEIERCRLLVRERASAQILGNKVLDISRGLCEEVLDRRLALAESYRAHTQRKSKERSHVRLAEVLAVSGLPQEYRNLYDLPPDEELLVIDKTIILMKEFSLHFATVFLTPETMELAASSVAKVSCHKLLPSMRDSLKRNMQTIIRQDFLRFMTDDYYEWIPASEYRKCILALQRTLRESPDDIFKHVTHYGQMDRNDQRLVREIVGVFLQSLLETKWEETVDAPDPEKSSRFPLRKSILSVCPPSSSPTIPR